MTNNTLTTKNCYVYALFRDDGRPCYVGKGTGDRMFHHGKKGSSHDNAHLAAIFAKAKRAGQTITARKIVDGLTKEEAFAEERRLIALYIEQYGERHIANKTPGGDGGSTKELMNRPHVKEAIRKASKERWADPEYKARVVATMTASANVPEIAAKRNASVKLIQQTDEYRANLSAAQYRRWQSKEARQKQSVSMKNATGSEEYRQKRRASTTRSWEDPQIRAKRTKGLREVMATEEYRATLSASQKARFSSQEARDKQRDIANEVFSRPEVIDKLSNSQKLAWADPKKRESRTKGLRDTMSTKEYKEKCSKRQKERYKDPSAKAAQSERMKIWWADRKAKKVAAE